MAIEKSASHLASAVLAGALAAVPVQAQEPAATAQAQAIQQLQSCVDPPAGLPPDVCRVDVRDERSVIQLAPQGQGRYAMLFATTDGSFEARATVLGRRVDELLDLIWGIQAMGGSGVGRIAQSAVVTIRRPDGTLRRFETELNVRVVVEGGSIRAFIPCVKN